MPHLATGQHNRTIDLSGQEGNAFALMGILQRDLRLVGMGDKFAAIQADMMSGDYQNLLKVFVRAYANELNGTHYHFILPDDDFEYVNTFEMLDEELGSKAPTWEEGY